MKKLYKINKTLPSIMKFVCVQLVILAILTTISIAASNESHAVFGNAVASYGSQKKKDITSAISTVSTKDISSRPIVNAVEAIKGKSAGVQVSVPFLFNN